MENQQIKVILKSEAKNKFQRILLLYFIRCIIELGVLSQAYNIINIRILLTVLNLSFTPYMKTILRKKDLKFYKDYLMKDIDNINRKLIYLLSECDNKSLKNEYGSVLKNYSLSYIKIFNQYNQFWCKLPDIFLGLVDIFIVSYFDNNTIELTDREKELTVILIIMMEIWIIITFLVKIRSKVDVSDLRQNINEIFIEIIDNSKIIKEYKTFNYHVELIRKSFNKFLDRLYGDVWWGYTGINSVNSIATGGFNVILVIYSYFVSHNSAVQKRISTDLIDTSKAAQEEFVALFDLINENSINEKILRYQIHDDAQSIELSKSINLFSIKDLNLRYNNKDLYKNQSFTIKRNSWTNIKGESGCGKTTLINCLLKKNKDYKGRILFLDKHEDYSYKNISNLISIYDDNYDLFSSQSILFNVTYGLKKITEEKIKELKHYFKLFNLNGFEDRLDENIEKCSLGQKQRIKIIRFIIHDRDIWILDEATSNLDKDTEKIVMQELKRIQIDKKKTVMFISHNEELYKYANSILKIEMGKIERLYV